MLQYEYLVPSHPVNQQATQWQGIGKLFSLLLFSPWQPPLLLFLILTVTWAINVVVKKSFIGFMMNFMEYSSYFSLMLVCCCNCCCIALLSLLMCNSGGSLLQSLNAHAHTTGHYGWMGPNIENMYSKEKTTYRFDY